MAQQVLLVTTDDIVRFTALDGNLDVNKFIPFVKVAQDTNIQSFLGQDLYTKITDDVRNGALTGDYLTLNTDYIKPMLIHWAMVSYLPWAAYQIAEKGVFKHTSEDSEAVSQSEVAFMIAKAEQIAQSYTQRFIDFVNLNVNLYPEYKTNGAYEVHPEIDLDFGGWML